MYLSKVPLTDSPVNQLIFMSSVTCHVKIHIMGIGMANSVTGVENTHNPTHIHDNTMNSLKSI